jgi:hypothetical protein
LNKKPDLPTASADPSLWSDQSQRSYGRTRSSYTDIAYRCCFCGKDAVFTALAQKRAFEVLKMHIHKRRVLCEPCWNDHHALERDIAAHEARWALEKPALRQDAAFLAAWRSLLVLSERYGARPNSATQAMLSKMLDGLGGTGSA